MRGTRSTRPRSSTGAVARAAGRQPPGRDHAPFENPPPTASIHNEERHEQRRAGGTVTTSDEPSTATCPVMSAAHQAVGITANQHWWPDSLNLRILRQNHPGIRPAGRGLRLHRGVQQPRLRRAGGRRRCPDDRLAGLVACRLRPLRRLLRPDDLARRGHLPHRSTAAAAAAPAPSASPRSTAGPTTSASTRPAACSGRSSRSTARRSPGPTC